MRAVQHWRVDRFLKVQSMIKMAEQEQERPLILLISPRRAADQIRFAIALDEGWGRGRCAAARLKLDSRASPRRARTFGLAFPEESPALG